MVTFEQMVESTEPPNEPLWEQRQTISARAIHVFHCSFSRYVQTIPRQWNDAGGHPVTSLGSHLALLSDQVHWKPARTGDVDELNLEDPLSLEKI